MHRHGKLRAACDRCHYLKNRCVRAGGPDSRCDRCERLNIDCVYRTNSRTGRPRARRASELAPSRNFSGDDRAESRVSYPTPVVSTSTETANVNPKQVFTLSSGNDYQNELADATGLAGSVNQNENERRNTAGRSLRSHAAASPQVMTHAEANYQEEALDWTLDFSPYVPADVTNGTFDEQWFSNSENQGETALQNLETFSFMGSDDIEGGSVARDLGTTTDRLLQMQIRLHHLSLATDQEKYAGRSATEQVLEATKSFLEILQATLVSMVDIPSAIGDPKPAPMSYITVLQVLTCYSYVLQVLDPVVSFLTLQKSDSAGRPGNSSHPALRIGFFSLASQPAMDADVHLHIILRLIQQLRVSIHTLASGHRDLASGIPERVEIGLLTEDTGPKLHVTPISITSQPIVDLISANEEPLVQRLSHLMSAY